MIASLLGMSLAPLALTAMRADPAGDGIEVAQLSFHSRIVIRVQSDSTPMMEIVEKKGPKCLPLASVGGAAVQSANSVDFILRGGQRVRAKLSSDCPALDYYSGFYIAPNADGQVCADRDVVRSRAGGECAIDRFRTLVARPRKK